MRQSNFEKLTWRIFTRSQDGNTLDGCSLGGLSYLEARGRTRRHHIEASGLAVTAFGSLPTGRNVS